MDMPIPPRASASPDLPDLLARASEMMFDPVRLRFLSERRRPISEHLADYRVVMESRGGARHVGQSMRRLRIMVRLCRVATWGDLASRPSLVLAARQKVRAVRPRRRSLGPRTVNAYVVSLQGFCRWMVDDYRAEWSPCRGIRPLAAHADVRHARRALSREEVLALIDAARRGKTIASIPGTERALGYILATTTGLRVGEIRSLALHSFALQCPEPSVSVLGLYTKNKRPACIPLRADVAELIRAHLAECGECGREKNIFRYPANSTYALRQDLAAAGIPYHLAGGQGGFADNHAQRHTFVSDLFNSGASPKEAQSLARHQDARLTLGRYAHVAASAQRAAVERLPAPAPAPAPAGAGAHTPLPGGARPERNGNGKSTRPHIGATGNRTPIC